jgi:hypothetical protein
VAEGLCRRRVSGSGPGGRQGTLQAVNARGDAPEVTSERVALGNGPKQHRGGDVVDEDLGRSNPPFGRGGTDGSRLRRWSQGQCQSSPGWRVLHGRGLSTPGQNPDSRHRETSQSVPEERPGSQMPGLWVSISRILGWSVNRYGWYSINVL